MMPARILLRIHANGSEHPEASGALALVPSAENTYVGNLSEQSTNLAQTILQSLADDAAQTGGVWAVAVQRANDEQCYAVNSKPMQSASLIKLFVAATVEENPDSVVAWKQYSGETADLLFHMLSKSGNEAPHTLVNRLGNGNAEAGMALVNAYCTKYGYQDTLRQADRKKEIIAVVAAVVGITLVGWLLFGERGYKAIVEKFFEVCMDGDV